MFSEDNAFPMKLDRKQNTLMFEMFWHVWMTRFFCLITITNSTAEIFNHFVKKKEKRNKKVGKFNLTWAKQLILQINERRSRFSFCVNCYVVEMLKLLCFCSDSNSLFLVIKTTFVGRVSPTLALEGFGYSSRNLM